MTTSKSKPGRGRPPKYPKSDSADKNRSVKRFQLSLNPELFEALEAFRKAQEFPLERSAVIETLIERFLVEKGFFPKESV